MTDEITHPILKVIQNRISELQEAIDLLVSILSGKIEIPEELQTHFDNKKMSPEQAEIFLILKLSELKKKVKYLKPKTHEIENSEIPQVAIAIGASALGATSITAKSSEHAVLILDDMSQASRKKIAAVIASHTLHLSMPEEIKEPYVLKGDHLHKRKGTGRHKNRWDKHPPSGIHSHKPRKQN